MLKDRQHLLIGSVKDAIDRGPALLTYGPVGDRVNISGTAWGVNERSRYDQVSIYRHGQDEGGSEALESEHIGYSPAGGDS